MKRKSRLKQHKNYLLDNMLSNDTLDTPSPDSGLIINGTSLSWYPDKYIDNKIDKEVEDLFNNFKLK